MGGPDTELAELAGGLNIHNEGKSMVLHHSDFTSQRTFSNVWRHFWLSQLGKEVLPASSG